uniref:Uncharacterized protein n=1 Tax=Marseillevirus sp. TaxID=2809551 RepID=A0AA96EJT5_9VIRU|nr:hypothetical protein MarFTMF_064 [Marseillevirus sp.]
MAEETHPRFAMEVWLQPNIERENELRLKEFLRLFLGRQPTILMNENTLLKEFEKIRKISELKRRALSTERKYRNGKRGVFR